MKACADAFRVQLFYVSVLMDLLCFLSVISEPYFDVRTFSRFISDAVGTFAVVPPAENHPAGAS